MTGFFTSMSPTCEFLAAFLDTHVIPECAARLAAFVSAATHLFVAFSITEELSIFGCFITRDVDVGSQARLLRGKIEERGVVMKGS